MPWVKIMTGVGEDGSALVMVRSVRGFPPAEVEVEVEVEWRWRWGARGRRS